MNNLIINADQAMPEGGTLEVRAENVFIDEKTAGYLYPRQPGPYVRITVKDQGVGIAEDVLAKIFDPYFTTKPQGSGLGLFTSYSIVKNHGGHIAVESALGQGTTFYVYLPATPQRAVAPQEEREAVPVAHGRILVMEDEEDIRDVIGAILDHFGYEVAFARDGVEALAAYISAKDAGVPFDAVILDLTIPGGMGAKETIARLKAFDPEVRAIVASGYANDPLLANYRAFGFCGCIIKPFKSDELTKVLYHAIAGRESPTT
ncbi:MAG: hypothetical protein KatS3mg131_2591 [Candidatus Tectimicrobiota bacterium]|nr:MAG: hypothetical protein KatS3mg131_2591 [Candidatus Tectomicrobia bacterium]